MIPNGQDKQVRSRVGNQRLLLEGNRIRIFLMIFVQPTGFRYWCHRKYPNDLEERDKEGHL